MSRSWLALLPLSITLCLPLQAQEAEGSKTEAPPFRPLPGSGTGVDAQRSLESMTAVIRQQQNALYDIYFQQLYYDNSISARLEFDLQINASGKVTQCSYKDAPANARDLADKLCAHLKQTQFGEVPGSGLSLYNFSLNLQPNS